MKISHLTRKLILYLLFFSILFSSIYIYLEQKSEYDKKFNKLNESFNQVENRILSQLSFSVWALDDDLLTIQLENILKLPGVVYVEIKDIDGEFIQKIGQKEIKSYKNKSFDLIYNKKGITRVIGTFNMQISFEKIDEEFLNDLIDIVLKEVLRFFLLSFLLLFIIHKIFIKHLLVIENYTKNISLKNLDKPLNLKKEDFDELNNVSNAINKMRNNILTEIKIKEKVQNELKQLNIDLDKKIKQEVIKNREKDLQLLQQSKNAALGEMIANIAHQWRQPLSVISAVTTGMKLEKEVGVLTDEQLFKKLDKISSTSKHLSNTIDEFRDFLKDDNKKIIFNLTKEIDKCLLIEESIIKANSIMIIKSLDDSISINNLPHGLSHSLINIINNAKDALNKMMDENNRFLFIESKSNNGNAIITLRDCGGGIPENIIDKIFEPYFTTKHQAQGTGLGLYMSYKIITENMNGIIEVRNVSYNYKDMEFTGAEFKIILPLD